MQDHFDVVIVGAGAAGLAAATRLATEPLGVVILEARGRIGGRAHTIQAEAGFPLDEGCGWLHSADRNVLASLAEEAGAVIDRTPPHWTRQSGDQHFSPSEQRAFREAFDAFEGRLAAAGKASGDSAAAAFFEPGCRWNPLMNAVSAYYNGAEYDRVSVKDYSAYEDTEVNWRVRDGYGAAIAALAPDVDIVLDCPVEAIDHGAAPIRLYTAKGALTADVVVVTAPTPILATERIRFSPSLGDKVAAACGLPLGVADKVFLHLAEPQAWPEEGHLFGRTDRTETGSYHLRPFGRPYIEAYLGGRHARQLEGEGPGAMAAFAIDELAALIGSEVRRKLAPITETRWLSDPWSMGSYSHALPGSASARARLAAPVEDRLFFAGEATHPSFYSTAHGAWETGTRAAEDVLAARRAGI